MQKTAAQPTQYQAVLAAAEITWNLQDYCNRMIQRQERPNANHVAAQLEALSELLEVVDGRVRRVG